MEDVGFSQHLATVATDGNLGLMCRPDILHDQVSQACVLCATSLKT